MLRNPLFYRVICLFLVVYQKKYIHLCNAIQLRYLQSNSTNNQAINPVTIRFTKSVTS